MPSIINSVNFSTNFTINNPTKQFVLTDLTDYTAPAIPTTGVKGVFKITDPSNTIIYNNTTYGAGSDIVRNISAVNQIVIPLPINADGTVVQGNYTLVYSVQITDGSNPVYIVTQTHTYNNQYVAPVVSITQTVDCISPLFTSVDVTDYTVNGVAPTITRTHTLNYPFGSAGEGSPLVSSAQTITTSTFYNGTQTTEISTILGYTFSDGLIVSDTVTGTKEILVDCTFICSIYCCLRSLYNNRENNRGVNQIEFNKYSALFDEVMSTVEIAMQAIDCGKTTDVNGYLTTIKTIANCTDDCSCNDGTPSLVTGLGGSGLIVVVQSGGAPITVSSITVGMTTTYTVTLSAAFVSKVNASYNTVVAAGTNVTVTGPVIVGDVHTYTVNAVLPTTLNTQQSRCLIQYSNFAAPTVVVTVTDNVSEGSNMTPMVVASAGAVGVGLWKFQENLYNVTGFQTASNSTFKPFISFEQLESQTLLGVVTTQANQFLSAMPVDIRILNIGSESFDFQFVEKATGLPLSNYAMVFWYKIMVNIEIKQ